MISAIAALMLATLLVEQGVLYLLRKRRQAKMNKRIDRALRRPAPMKMDMVSRIKLEDSLEKQVKLFISKETWPWFL